MIRGKFTMLSLKQKAGIRLAGVTAADADDIQAMLDAARGNFDADRNMKLMLEAADSTVKDRFVYLEAEGWHQLEDLYGKKWKHITINDTYETYHCYAVVTGAMDKPKAVSHSITSITYRGGKIEIML